MTFGHAILPASRPLIPATIQTIGPRQVMADTLAEYLRGACFRIFGDLAPDEPLRLEEVFAEWPDVSQQLPYPCASVVERTDTFYQPHNFVPSALEDTLGTFDGLVGEKVGDPKTVLWKVAEASVEFQVDFWTSNVPHREAIEARLGHLFNPNEERSGVLIEGPHRYYSLPVRATLLSHRRIDTTATVYPNERRLQTVIRCEVDVVHLRAATLLRPAVTTGVTDPNDPEETQ